MSTGDAAPDDREALLRSSTWTPEHLVVLGRLAEESASIEWWARAMLEHALNLPGEAAAALFLGSRMPELSRRLKALADTTTAAEWLEEAADWAKRAASAVGKRDELLHRAPTIIGVPTREHVRRGMRPARRNQVLEEIGDQVIDALRELVAVRREAFDLLWRAAGGDDSVPPDEAPEAR